MQTGPGFEQSKVSKELGQQIKSKSWISTWRS